MPSHNKRYKKGFKILGIPDVKSVPLLHWLRIKRGRLRLMFREKIIDLKSVICSVVRC